jgi:hypothetical protein
MSFYNYRDYVPLNGFDEDLNEKYLKEEKDESEYEDDDDKIKDPDYEYEDETSESESDYEEEIKEDSDYEEEIKEDSDYEEEKDKSESEDDDDKIKDPDYEYESENNSSEYDSDYDSENDFENEATNNDKYRYSLKIIKFCECGSNTTKYISREQDIINFLCDEFFYRYQEYCGDVEANIKDIIKRVIFLMTQYNVYDDYNTWNDREYVLSKHTTSGFFLSRSEEFRKNIKIIDLFELC